MGETTMINMQPRYTESAVKWLDNLHGGTKA